jgi:hypothetical protein
VPFNDGKEVLRSSYKGKQLAVAAPKQGKTTDAYFEKKHNWISEGAPYTDRWKYSETQTEKKKGFLASDFSKRDEFSNTIRTGQYREQLKVRAACCRWAVSSRWARPGKGRQRLLACTPGGAPRCVGHGQLPAAHPGSRRAARRWRPAPNSERARPAAATPACSKRRSTPRKRSR